MKKVIKSILLVTALMAGVVYAAYAEHQTTNVKEMADPGGTIRP
jgi:multisubunit Na+/H+ antiporter MnhC subunit